MKEQINSIINTVILGAIAAAASVTAFLFAVVAAFLWAQQTYDTIVAAFVACGIFLLVAVAALLALVIARRRTEQRRAREEAEAAKNAAPAWLTDPTVLVTAATVARTIGIGRLIPLAIAAVAAFGVAGFMGRSSSGTTKMRKPVPGDAAEGTPKERKRAA